VGVRELAKSRPIRSLNVGAADLHRWNPVLENFKESIIVDADGRELRDIKLSRFACSLVAMNGDVRTPQVAKAQAYFARLVQATQDDIRAVEDVEVSRSVMTSPSERRR